MVPIFIGSISHFSGKNLIGLGLGIRLKKAGLKVGYFKPLGILPAKVGNATADRDAEFFAEVLQLHEPPEIVCPIVLSREMMRRILLGEVEGSRERIRAAYQEVSRDKDVLLIGGIGNLYNGLLLGTPQVDLIREIGAKAVIIDKFEVAHESLDGFLQTKSMLGDNLVGVVFNRVSPGTVSFLREYAAPFLKTRGIRTLGVIQEDPVLGATPVRDLVDALHADVLCCDDKLDELVEEISIGAMNVESALRHFRIVHNKAVITGGDRADIQLAALETSTRALILTGELYPNDLIVGRAQQAGVPILVVRSDTAGTVERCDRVMGQLSIRSERKLRRAVEVIDKDVDLKGLAEAVGLKL